MLFNVNYAYFSLGVFIKLNLALMCGYSSRTRGGGVSSLLCALSQSFDNNFMKIDQFAANSLTSLDLVCYIRIPVFDRNIAALT